MVSQTNLRKCICLYIYNLPIPYKSLKLAVNNIDCNGNTQAQPRSILYDNDLTVNYLHYFWSTYKLRYSSCKYYPKEIQYNDDV